MVFQKIQMELEIIFDFSLSYPKRKLTRMQANIHRDIEIVTLKRVSHSFKQKRKYNTEKDQYLSGKLSFNQFIVI